MEIDRQALLECFLTESRESLAGLEQLLIQLEQRPDDAEILGEVFRAVHTLKGNAASLGFPQISALAHAAEDLLDALRRRALDADGEIVSLLLAARDHAAVALDDVAAGRVPRGGHEDLAADLRRRASGRDLAPSAAPRTAPAGVSRSGSSSLRVPVEKLDRLLALCGEIAVSRLRLENQLDEAGGPAREALETHRDADKLHAALQELVLETRMVPLRAALHQQHRTVRDVAAESGRAAVLVIEGEDVEVDTSVVDLVRDAITHSVRNAVDHGIEPPAVRRAAGKEPEGTIRLSARRDGGQVVVEVADDGAGVDLARVRDRAHRDGLLSAAEAPSEADLFELLYRPGFTTADAVTATSGRGVGMDVVRRNLASVRGSVRLDSTRGQGTTVTLRVPLTITTLEALRVRVADEVYVLPTEHVSECIDLAAGRGLRGVGQSGVLELRGRPVPYLRLREALGAHGPAAVRENVVVIGRDGQEAGLAVDAVLGSGHVVMRPLGKFLPDVPVIAGSVILGSGDVALVLDAPALLKTALPRRATDAARGSA